MTKACLTCGVEKALEEFNLSKSGRLGRHAHCKVCRPAFRKAHPGYERGKASDNARKRRKYATDPEYRQLTLDRNRSWRYGVTPEKYDEMLAQQAGGCAICRAKEPTGHGQFHVDHDHACCPGFKSCGKCVRGLLCTSCNTGLGMFRDDTQLLSFAKQYLERGM